MTVRTVSDVLANCMSTDKHRLILQCVLEDTGEDGVHRIATDTHRLAVLKMPGEGGVNPSVRILYPDWAALSLAEGKYPYWRKVVVSEWEREARIPIGPFIQALKSVGVVGRDNNNRVFLRFDGANLSVRAKSEAVGEVVCTVALAAPFEGEPFETAYNYSYLLDCLPVGRAKDFKNVFLRMNAPSRPAVLAYETEGDFARLTVTLMPMALA